MAANDVPCCETMFWVYLAISVSLVCFAGLMSGLTLGLMSLSLVDLQVLIKAGQPEDKKNAAKILPIVKNQHLLLCTLLICNSLAMEALPIFLDALLPAWGAILISVTLILAFGEIIPQSLCSRYGLRIGAKLSVFVRLLVIIFFPLSYPISKVLDLLLGHGRSALLRRAELKTLVDMHGNEAGNGGELTHDETTIITGALDLTQKTAKDAMTPLSKVFAVDLNSKLNEELSSLFISKGHSRVPVYSGTLTNIVGLILVKNLIKCRPEEETEIRNLTIRKIPRVHEFMPLYDILNQFQKGQSHMAVVVKTNGYPIKPTKNSKTITEMVSEKLSPQTAERQDFERAYRYNGISSPGLDGKNEEESRYEVLPNEEVIGIITMEDVLEQLLQEPIFDETDGYVDIHNKININMLPGMKHLIRSPRATTSVSSETSPFSSSIHQTPVSYPRTPLLHSPISPYIQSPFVRPILYGSPGTRNFGLSSPVRSSRSLQTSPSPHQRS